jgi:hypothetical protein
MEKGALDQADQIGASRDILVGNGVKIPQACPHKAVSREARDLLTPDPLGVPALRLVSDLW